MRRSWRYLPTRVVLSSNALCRDCRPTPVPSQNCFRINDRCDGPPSTRPNRVPSSYQEKPLHCLGKLPTRNGLRMRYYALRGCHDQRAFRVMALPVFIGWRQRPAGSNSFSRGRPSTPSGGPVDCLVGGQAGVGREWDRHAGLRTAGALIHPRLCPSAPNVGNRRGNGMTHTF